MKDFKFDFEINIDNVETQEQLEALLNFGSKVYDEQEKAYLRAYYLTQINNPLNQTENLSLKQNIISFLFHKNKIKDNQVIDFNSLNFFSFFSKFNYQKEVMLNGNL
jgi:hypothetical protein